MTVQANPIAPATANEQSTNRLVQNRGPLEMAEIPGIVITRDATSADIAKNPMSRIEAKSNASPTLAAIGEPVRRSPRLRCHTLNFLAKTAPLRLRVRCGAFTEFTRCNP